MKGLCLSAVDTHKSHRSQIKILTKNHRIGLDAIQERAGGLPRDAAYKLDLVTVGVVNVHRSAG